MSLQPEVNLDVLAAELLAKSIAMNVNRRTGEACCGDDAWRGRLCPYHSGFRDGMEVLTDKMVELLPPPKKSLPPWPEGVYPGQESPE